jgi:DNA 3'-phosphatase
MDIQNKKVLFADLDGTLIQTASGKTFAEDCTDFRIRKDVLDKIKCMDEMVFICIVTNQGGIPKYTPKHDFEAKLSAIIQFITNYCNDNAEGCIEVFARYCISEDNTNPSRKPNTGMLESIMNDELRWADKPFKDKANMLMIGDASGKDGQFSDSDKVCAERFGIDYLDVEDFLKA